MTRRRDIYIGDLQGCGPPFRRLLDKIGFDPAADRLCLAGDLVNRGGNSLAVLREIVGLGKPHFSVLGNHDLHLLAYARHWPNPAKRNREFEAILEHKHGERIVDWLKRQPLLWLNERDRIALVHAGIDPRWNRSQARDCAEEVEKVLRGPKFDRFIDRMYGDEPARWEADQKRFTRLRTITNVLTRMRFARSDGTLELSSSGDLNKRPKGFRPWFELLHRDWARWSVVFGHWSMLGYHDHNPGKGRAQAICLDSGCVWGGCLTALIVDRGKRRIVQQHCKQR
jgi:bis(5'-nucleosyl)-tetraphosphatase (symmetrical)